MSRRREALPGGVPGLGACHEGFCLWDSATCAFNATDSAAGRDLVREFVEAVRAEGLKVGFYYSPGDWHNADWFRGWQGDTAARERFVAYTHALVSDLSRHLGGADIFPVLPP